MKKYSISRFVLKSLKGNEEFQAKLNHHYLLTKSTRLEPWKLSL